MSSVSYLFGNVNNDGKLKQDESNKEFLTLIKTVEESSEYLTNILSSNIELEVNSSSDAPGNRVLPGKDAVDYEGEEELADDLLPTAAPMLIPNTLPSFAPMPQSSKARSSPMCGTTLTELFPSYVPGGRLKFSELFASKTAKSYPLLRLDKLKKSIGS